MPTSKADRLNKLFERDSLPPPPDPQKAHIADTEIISKMQPAQQAWKVPNVAQTPRRVTRSPPRTGRDIDQLTSSDDDEYISAFKKMPIAKPETTVKPRKKTYTSGGSKNDGKPKAKIGSNSSTNATAKTEANSGNDDGVSDVDRDGQPLVGRFCPLMLVTKFCYKYMDDPNDRVSKHFFASGKIWNRIWDIYYIHPPTTLFAKPILLVPESQVQTLLDEINSAFRISIKLPRDPFLLAFYHDGTPAPTLLGTSQSRKVIGELEQEIPSPSEDHGECAPDAGPEMEQSFACFKEKMERATAAAKKKGVALKKVKAKDRLAAHVNSCEALWRGQRYLGLRPLDRKGGLSVPDASLSWVEQQDVDREQKIKYGHLLEPLDVEEPAPQPFDRDVVFISVDVEAYERAHNIITEVGISTLDAADIKSLAPGDGGANWMECIRSRHFRIGNHAHLRNTTFCTGDPEKFLFGRSEFVSMNEIGRVVDSCFEPPYSADFVHDGKYRAADDTSVSTTRIGNQLQSISIEAQKLVQRDVLGPQFLTEPVDVQGPTNAEQDLANKVAVSNILPSSELPNDATVSKPPSATRSSQSGSPENIQISTNHLSSQQRGRYRDIILVGHDLDSDLQYLSSLKSAIFHKPPAVVYPQPLEPENPLRQHILESLDTANLYQVWKRETNITSLAKVLVGVERTGWHLHNGGNDARYTLEALIGILLRARVEEGGPTEAPGWNGVAGMEDGRQLEEEKLARRIREKQEAVERDDCENVAMWNHAIGPYGESVGKLLPDPYQQQGGTSKGQECEVKSTADADAHAHAEEQAPTNKTPDLTSPYPWSSCPRATRDGGNPKGFAMPTPEGEQAKQSPSSRRREEVLRLQGEGGREDRGTL